MFAAISTRTLIPALLCAAGLQALVAPNPASLLKDKRVLVIDGTHGSHADARTAMTAKLNQIKTLVGFNMTQVTTPPTTGTVNSMPDSNTPLGGHVPMSPKQLGEVVFGGVGSGLYGMLMFALVAVFIAGLMVGRTR